MLKVASRFIVGSVREATLLYREGKHIDAFWKMGDVFFSPKTIQQLMIEQEWGYTELAEFWAYMLVGAILAGIGHGLFEAIVPHVTNRINLEDG